MKSFLLLALLAACTVTGGSHLAADSLEQIQVGQTTEPQVIELLGKPMNVIFDGSGGKTMLYTQAVGHPGLFGPKVEYRSASVHIGPGGVVDAVDLPTE